MRLPFRRPKLLPLEPLACEEGDHKGETSYN